MQIVPGLSQGSVLLGGRQLERTSQSIQKHSGLVDELGGGTVLGLG